MKALPLAICLALCACASSIHDHSPQPYAGQQARGIKALSDSEVSGYLAGSGMGLAKPAELNGYPGPLHSIENDGELALTAAQRAQIEALMRAHREEARRLGAELVRLERELDALFAQREATPQLVEAKLGEIAPVQAALRASHLKAHLATTELLTPEQVERYRKLRGYGRGS